MGASDSKIARAADVGTAFGVVVKLHEPTGLNRWIEFGNAAALDILFVQK